MWGGWGSTALGSLGGVEVAGAPKSAIHKSNELFERLGRTVWGKGVGYERGTPVTFFFFFSLSSLELSDTKVYEP